MRRLWLCSLGLVLAAGCQETEEPLVPELNVQPAPRPELTVLTRNLYLGTDIDQVLNAPVVPVAAAEAWQEIVANHFPERAEAIAAEIASAGAALVGLQEVILYRLQNPSDFVLGNVTPNATAVAYDYLEILQAALAARGLSYQATCAQSTDVELPMVTSAVPTFADIRYTDRDCILVRSDIPIRAATGGNFTARISTTIGGVPLTRLRGWNAVLVKVDGEELVFMNAHPETQDVAPIQELQVQELISLVAGQDRPVILVGDMNSAANEDAPPASRTASYGMLLDAGFRDLYLAGDGALPGLTCCHSEVLSQDVRVPDQRLDLVLLRDDGRAANAEVIARVVGDRESDRTPLGHLWPSDHNGVAVTMRPKVR